MSRTPTVFDSNQQDVATEILQLAVEIRSFRKSRPTFSEWCSYGDMGLRFLSILSSFQHEVENTLVSGLEGSRSEPKREYEPGLWVILIYHYQMQDMLHRHIDNLKHINVNLGRCCETLQNSKDNNDIAENTMAQELKEWNGRLDREVESDLAIWLREASTKILRKLCGKEIAEDFRTDTKGGLAEYEQGWSALGTGTRDLEKSVAEKAND